MNRLLYSEMFPSAYYGRQLNEIYIELWKLPIHKVNHNIIRNYRNALNVYMNAPYKSRGDDILIELCQNILNKIEDDFIKI